MEAQLLKQQEGESHKAAAPSLDTNKAALSNSSKRGNFTLDLQPGGELATLSIAGKSDHEKTWQTCQSTQTADIPASTETRFQEEVGNVHPFEWGSPA